MNYKKPTLVAKSEPKRTFIAGCPTKERVNIGFCSIKCELRK